MNDDDATKGCAQLIAYAVISLVLGAPCFDYWLYSVFGKNIPWYADCVVGFALGPLNITAAIVCWIIRLCGIETPFIG